MLDLLKQLAYASRDDLIAIIQYQHVENEVMRSKFDGRVPVVQEDRWKLQRFAKALPKRFDEHVITIAKPRTVRSWGRKKPKLGKKRGRRMTDEELRKLVIRLAEENDWGVKRIHGELIKLGLGGRVSESSIRRILRGHGIPPHRSGMIAWERFRARHPKALWSCDFFSVPTRTKMGRQDGYVLVFVHWPTRRAWFSSSTYYPNQDWVAQQARNWLMWLKDEGLSGSALVLDRDMKFGTKMRVIMESEGWEYWRTPARMPQCNGFAESMIGSIKRDLIDHLLFDSLDDLDRAVLAYRDYYHSERPHRGLDNRTIISRPTIQAREQFEVADIETVESAGGVLKSYRWKPERVAA
jgi:putative transposase